MYKYMFRSLIAVAVGLALLSPPAFAGGKKKQRGPAAHQKSKVSEHGKKKPKKVAAQKQKK